MRCLIYILFLAPFFSYSQTISRSVIASQGDFYSNSSGSLSWTLGEISVETYSNSGKIVTQGFQQPDSLLFTGINELYDEFNFVLSPNPTSDFIFITTNSVKLFDLLVMDVLGKEMYLKRNCLESERINFSGFSSGTYFVSISNNEGMNKKYKCFKID